MNYISPSTYHITRILDNCKLHAGTDIAASLGISRTAVWKIMQRLKKFGVDIETHHGGYQLKSPLQLLDPQFLGQDQNIALEVFETLDSTNNYLKARQPRSIPHFCLAERQTSGRGRMGRTWISPFGCNIYLSLSYPFSEDISELSGLSLVIGISVVNVLKTLSPTTLFQLKWPNDIYVNNKKLGGILVEMMAEANGGCRAIIGVGLNVNFTVSEIDRPWTSIEKLVGQKINRNPLVANIMNSLLKTIQEFRLGGLKEFVSQWNLLDALAGQKISLSCAHNKLVGIACGIDELGRLLLELPTGERKACSSGDTTILRNLP